MKNSSAKREDSRQEYILRINCAIEFIIKHLDEKLTLETLARVALFSQFHFHRIFKALTGETPNDFIIRLRLQQAANMLVFQPHRSITDVAFEAGFSSSGNFSRVFTPAFGESPKTWRKNELAKYKKFKPNNTFPLFKYKPGTVKMDGSPYLGGQI
ncbi:MAG: helix-turn-helix transcriptional regulator [bacterium]|nr:helix-turn-helix transcriptional regulator [bacterium]